MFKRFNKRTSSICSATIAIFALSINTLIDSYSPVIEHVIFFAISLGLIRIYALSIDIEKKGVYRDKKVKSSLEK